MDFYYKEFDEKNVEELSKRYPQIRKTIKKEFCKVTRYKREIIRQFKKVQDHTELLKKYLELMKKEESRYLKMVNLLNPKMTIKRHTKFFQQLRGKVWWSVGRFK